MHNGFEDIGAEVVRNYRMMDERRQYHALITLVWHLVDMPMNNAYKGLVIGMINESIDHVKSMDDDYLDFLEDYWETKE